MNSPEESLAPGNTSPLESVTLGNVGSAEVIRLIMSHRPTRRGSTPRYQGDGLATGEVVAVGGPAVGVGDDVIQIGPADLVAAAGLPAVPVPRPVPAALRRGRPVVLGRRRAPDDRAPAVPGRVGRAAAPGGE